MHGSFQFVNNNIPLGVQFMVSTIAMETFDLGMTFYDNHYSTPSRVLYFFDQMLRLLFFYCTVLCGYYSRVAFISLGGFDCAATIRGWCLFKETW